MKIFLNEAFKNFKINPKYTHFAVLKSDGKIINGWDYNGYDSDELNSDKNHYFIYDIKDMGYTSKDVKIITKRALQSKNIDPFNLDNWG